MTDSLRLAAILAFIFISVVPNNHDNTNTTDSREGGIDGGRGGGSSGGSSGNIFSSGSGGASSSGASSSGGARTSSSDSPDRNAQPPEVRAKCPLPASASGASPSAGSKGGTSGGFTHFTPRGGSICMRKTNGVSVSGVSKDASEHDGGDFYSSEEGGYGSSGGDHHHHHQHHHEQHREERMTAANYRWEMLYLMGCMRYFLYAPKIRPRVRRDAQGYVVPPPEHHPSARFSGRGDRAERLQQGSSADGSSSSESSHFAKPKRGGGESTSSTSSSTSTSDTSTSAGNEEVPPSKSTKSSKNLGSPGQYFGPRFPLSAWPLDQSTEYRTARAAAQVLQPYLDSLVNTNKLIRARFGPDYVARRPTTKVREAETVLVVQFLKVVNEAALVTANGDLFDELLDRMQAEALWFADAAVRDVERRRGRKALDVAAKAGDGAYNEANRFDVEIVEDESSNPRNLQLVPTVYADPGAAAYSFQRVNGAETSATMAGSKYFAAGDFSPPDAGGSGGGSAADSSSSPGGSASSGGVRLSVHTDWE